MCGPTTIMLTREARATSLSRTAGTPATSKQTKPRGAVANENHAFNTLGIVMKAAARNVKGSAARYRRSKSKDPGPRRDGKLHESNAFNGLWLSQLPSGSRGGQREKETKRKEKGGRDGASRVVLFLMAYGLLWALDFFLMVSPAKFGRLGSLHFWQVDTRLSKARSCVLSVTFAYFPPLPAL